MPETQQMKMFQDSQRAIDSRDIDKAKGDETTHLIEMMATACIENICSHGTGKQHVSPLFYENSE